MGVPSLPSGQFLRLLAIGGPLRSVSLQLYGGPSDQFLRKLYGPPSDLFLRILYGDPLRSVSSLTKWGAPWSVSLLTIWGPIDFIFFILLCLKLSWGAPIFFNFQGASAPSCPSPCGRSWVRGLPRILF